MPMDETGPGMAMMNPQVVIATEFEYAAPTPTSDRECKVFSTCDEADDTFESSSPTFSTDRICTQRTSCDFLLAAEIEFPPEGRATFEMFPGSATRDRICRDVEQSCDWDSEFFSNTNSNWDLYALGAFASTWGDWGAVFTAYDLQDTNGMVSYDVARSYVKSW